MVGVDGSSLLTDPQTKLVDKSDGQRPLGNAMKRVNCRDG